MIANDPQDNPASVGSLRFPLRNHPEITSKQESKTRF
jgi:hypothetical protein